MVGARRLASLRVLAGRLLLLPALLLVLTFPAAAADDTTSSKKAKAIPETVDDLKALQNQVRAVIAKVTPATVGVRIGSASGSGVIISEDGYVLTAGHVSGEPGRNVVLIFPDGKQVKGKSLGSNKNIDSGLIKISDEGKWPHVEMGRSADVAKGQWCITIGHPGGFRPGRTPPVRLGRVLQNTDGYIQTDCTLVGGDSGGPLFDLDGKVIAIHSRIGGTLKDNIHVPVDTYRETWDRLAAGEVWPAPNQAYMAVELDPDAEGCKIARVVEDGPAAKAGLKADDVILELNGKKISSYEDLPVHLRSRKPGDEITLKIRRNGDPMTIKLTLGKRPS